MKKQVLVLLIGWVYAVAACGATTPLPPSPQPEETDIAITATPEPEPPETVPELEAAITAVSNQVLARTTADREYVDAEKGMILWLGGGLQTSSDGRASLDLLPEGTIIRVGPNSIFTVKSRQPTDSPPTCLQLVIGKVWILLKGGTMEVETPSGVAAVRGSMMGVNYDPEIELMQVTCLEGHCTLENEAGRVTMTDGQVSFIKGNLWPAAVKIMETDELQEWVNENPDAWLYFEPGKVPDWLPAPDSEWLATLGGYFDRVLEEYPLPEEYLQEENQEIPTPDESLLENPPDGGDLPDDGGILDGF